MCAEWNSMICLTNNSGVLINKHWIIYRFVVFFLLENVTVPLIQVCNRNLFTAIPWNFRMLLYMHEKSNRMEMDWQNNERIRGNVLCAFIFPVLLDFHWISSEFCHSGQNEKVSSWKAHKCTHNQQEWKSSQEINDDDDDDTKGSKPFHWFAISLALSMHLWIVLEPLIERIYELTTFKLTINGQLI